MSASDYFDDPYIHATNDHRSAQVIQVEQGKSLAVMALALSVGAIVGMFMMAVLVYGLVDSKAKQAAAVAVVQAARAKQDVDLARHDIQTLQVELKKHGIDIPVN